ncbi:hypothetical protein HHL16_24560 [Pseudoflavitalea sp. G-6-1-2]|uniref:hypothetical protein n=1 Tax=Pseudoflavitalea sp. G-6-1-2 TaxID=2728841 RepID=UPI00146B8345|nr:hypothetical protein [Pseudoflavitalea sp. G-6-1-2]NML24073.1 hypothetical protein [Pseudoflavitalea sp. G-6-1-2]
MKNVAKTSMSIVALLVILTLSFSTSAFANGEKEKAPKNESTNSIELKHIGDYENQPIFQLNLTTSEADEFTITLRDSDGNLLYADKIKGTVISKKFLLTTQEIGDNIVTIEVRSKKSPKAEVYTINRKQNLVEETYVTKIR